jgi:hypothetical protein
MSAETRGIANFGPSQIALPSTLLRRILPPMVLAVGLLLVVGWTGLLGYGLFELAGLVF